MVVQPGFVSDLFGIPEDRFSRDGSFYCGTSWTLHIIIFLGFGRHNIEDTHNETIKELKRLLDKKRAKSQQLELDFEESHKYQIFGIDRFKGNPIDFCF